MSSRGSRSAGDHLFASYMDEGDEVTQAEFNNYQRLFNHYDQDNSGSISFDEIYNLLQTLGVFISEEEARQMFKEADYDESGELEFDEFLAMIIHNKNLIHFAKSRGECPDVRDAMKTDAFIPDDVWRWYWDTLILMSTLYYCGWVALFMLYAFRDYPPHWPLWCYTLLDGMLFFIFAGNMWVRFRTAYTDHRGLLIQDLRKIRQHYVKGLFTFDFLATIPLDTVLRISLGSVYTREEVADDAMPQTFNDTTGTFIITFASALRLLHVISVPRLFSVSELNHLINPSYVRFNYHIVPILRLVFWSLICCHWTAVLAMSVSIGVPADTDGIPGYIDCLYWVGYTVSTVGYGEILVAGDLAKIFAIGMFLVSIMVNAVVVAKVGELFRDKSLREESQIRMRNTLTLLNHFDIPGDLANDILSFQYHVLKSNLSKSYSEIINSLPPILQDKLAMHRGIQILAAIPFFKDASLECKTALAIRLQAQVVPPDEFITVTGEKSEAMYVLNHGFAQVLTQEGLHQSILRAGEYFEENALLSPNGTCPIVERSIRAMTYCDVFVLRMEYLRETLRRFPTLAKSLRKEADSRNLGILVNQDDVVKMAPPVSGEKFGPLVSSGNVKGLSDNSPTSVVAEIKPGLTPTVMSPASIRRSQSRNSVVREAFAVPADANQSPPQSLTAQVFTPKSVDSVAGEIVSPHMGGIDKSVGEMQKEIRDLGRDMGRLTNVLVEAMPGFMYGQEGGEEKAPQAISSGNGKVDAISTELQETRTKIGGLESNIKDCLARIQESATDPDKASNLIAEIESLKASMLQFQSHVDGALTSINTKP